MTARAFHMLYDGKGHDLAETPTLRAGLRRVCVAEGDTCGHAVHQTGIYELEYVIPVAPGSPLCCIRSHDRRFEGVEISLKPGQVGKPDYFGCILRGG